MLLKEFKHPLKKRRYVLVKCDKCGKETERDKFSYLNSLKKNKEDLCISCRRKEVCSRPEYKEKLSRIINNKISLMTAEERSELYTSKIIKTLSPEEKKQKYGNDSWKSNSAFLEKQKESNGNSEHVKKAISLMTEEQRKEKYSRRGKENGMYGVPPPKGTGIGYSGWYNGLFFRSFLELSFIHQNIDKDIKSAESIYRIQYIDEQGNDRNYHPDFILENKVVEVKPSKLIPKNNLKIEAANNWFSERNIIYEVMTEKQIKNLNKEEILNLINTGELVLTDKSYKRFMERI